MDTRSITLYSMIYKYRCNWLMEMTIHDIIYTGIYIYISGVIVTMVLPFESQKCNFIQVVWSSFCPFGGRSHLIFFSGSIPPMTIHHADVKWSMLPFNEGLAPWGLSPSLYEKCMLYHPMYKILCRYLNYQRSRDTLTTNEIDPDISEVP